MSVTAVYKQDEDWSRFSSEEPRQSSGVNASATFSTEGLPSSQQFAAYREFCSPVIDIQWDESSSSGFSASCEMWTLKPFAVRRIRTSAGCFERSAAQVRRDSLDHWVFNLTRSGRQEARTSSGGELDTDAGALSLFSLAGPYSGRRTSVDWVGLFVPRGAFPAIDKAFDHREQTALRDSLGRLFARYLVSLSDELPRMSHDELSAAVQATRALLAEFIASPVNALSSTDAILDAPRLRCIRDFIDKNLGSWNLHTGRICKMAGISRSNLYRMFEPYGGVVRYIQRRRLQQAHELLADPGCTRAINAIASDYCFPDPSTFSRAFRQEFGYSPTDLRRRADGDRTAAHNSRPPQHRSGIGGWDILYGY